MEIPIRGLMHVRSRRHTNEGYVVGKNLVLGTYLGMIGEICDKLREHGMTATTTINCFRLMVMGMLRGRIQSIQASSTGHVSRVEPVAPTPFVFICN